MFINQSDLYEQDAFVSQRHSNVECDTHVNLPTEAVYVSEGEVSMMIEGEKCVIRAGEMAFVLPFEKHSFETPTHSECIVMMFQLSLCRAFFRAMQGKIPSRRVIAPDRDLMRWVNACLPGTEEIPDELTATALAGALLREITAKGEFRPGENRYDTLFLSVLRSIDRDVTRPISLTEVARELGTHPVTVSRHFSASAGMGFSEYIALRRVMLAARLLTEETESSIAEIAFRAGFGSIRQFNRTFLEHFGTVPKNYRSQNRDSRSASGKSKQ